MHDVLHPIDPVLPPWTPAASDEPSPPEDCVVPLPSAAGGEPVRLDLTAGVLTVAHHDDESGSEALYAAGFAHDETTGRRVASWSPEREDRVREITGEEPRVVAPSPAEIARSRMEHLHGQADRDEQRGRKLSRQANQAFDNQDPDDLDTVQRGVDLAQEARFYRSRARRLRHRAEDVPLEVAAAWEAAVITARLEVLERRVREVRFALGRRGRRVRAFLRQRVERELQLLERVPHPIPRHGEPPRSPAHREALQAAEPTSPRSAA